MLFRKTEVQFIEKSGKSLTRAESSPWRRVTGAVLAALLISASILIVSPTTPAGATGYPGQDEIEAARAAVSSAQSSVADLDAAMAGLESALAEADALAAVAEDNVTVAQDDKQTAERELVEAEKKSAEADAALAAAREDLATVAMDAYRSGGSMEQLKAITSADGFDDVIVKSEAVSRASSEADSQVQTVKAAEIVADSMRRYAAEAAETAAKAEETAREAAVSAQEARSQAQRAVSEVSAARASAISRLVVLRDSSVELEQQRQDGLARERQEAAQQAFEAELASQADSGSDGGEEVGNVRPNPVPRPTTTSGPEDPKPEPTKTSAPNPKPTSTPKPTTPKPTPTKDPAPDPSPSWNSSAGQGSKAVSHALTLQGKPYSQTRDGGVGPTYYDCSGLTQKSWGKAGVYIPRTSQAQYNYTTKIPLSEARPGDLVFWGTGGSGSRIYHVEVYIGGGQVMGAHKPGTPAGISSVYRGGAVNLLPVVGRP